MGFFRRLANKLKFWKWTEELTNTDDESVHSLREYECYLYKIQCILVWEKPQTSVATIIGVNILFWLLGHWEVRLYGALCGMLFTLVAHEAWVRHVWPEIRLPSGHSRSVALPTMPSSPRVLTVTEISGYVSSASSTLKRQYSWFREFRTRQPGLCCCLLTATFGCLSMLGRAVSGLTLVYAVSMAMLLAPGFVIHVLPPHSQLTLRNCFHSLSSALVPSTTLVGLDVDPDEEYLPTMNSENIALLTLAGGDHRTSERGSSSPMSFLTETCVMPSHEESSLDGLDSLASFGSDLDSTLTRGDGDSSRHSSLSLDESQAMRFTSGHFNGDESSSEEEARFSMLEDRNQLSLSPPRVPVLASLAGAVAANFAGIGAMGHSLVASVIRTPAKPTAQATQGKAARQLDSDEEFEIIDDDDLS